MENIDFIKVGDTIYSIAGEVTKEDVTVDATEVDVTDKYVSIENGYVAGGKVGGKIIVGGFSQRKKYNVPAGTLVRIEVLQNEAYYFAMTDANDTIYEIVKSGSYSEYTFAVLNVDAVLQVSVTKFQKAFFTSANGTPLKDKVMSDSQRIDSLSDNVDELEKEIETLPKASNHWSGKAIWWCGTSIPAGSDATLGSEETVAGMYPKQVGINLNATMFNVAAGGSMCRANVRTGDYNGISFNAMTSCLSRTFEEVEDIISNYNTYKNLPKNTSWKSSLSESDINRLRLSSFEEKLIPFLKGVKTTRNPKGLIPDLFVIDHCYNDFGYLLPDGTTDIMLEPKKENILSGLLAEDSYMTANNYERLAYFLNVTSSTNATQGDGAKLIQRIGSAKMDDFVASVNRNCFIGAINFIVTVILSYIPKGRIVFISNYEYKYGDKPTRSSIIDAQHSIAESWAFPICDVYKYLGFSGHLIPTAPEYFKTLYATTTADKIPSVAKNCINNDLGCDVFRLYNQDGVHPHTDISGDANNCYAGVISEFLKMCR